MLFTPWDGSLRGMELVREELEGTRGPGEEMAWDCAEVPLLGDLERERRLMDKWFKRLVGMVEDGPGGRL